MPASTMTSKGQITVPVEVRRVLGLRSGSRVNFVRTESGTYELIPETRSVAALRGMIATDRVVGLEAMDEAIAASGVDAAYR